MEQIAPNSWTSKVTDSHQCVPDVAKIAINRGIGEVTSIIAFMGTAHFLDEVCEFRPVKQVIAKVLHPLVGGIDWFADRLPALESDEETQARHNATTQERAYQYADILFDYSARMVASMAAQKYTQEMLDGMMITEKLPSSTYGWSTLWDRGVQVGSMLTLNIMFHKQNEAVQDKIQAYMEKAWNVPTDVANARARDLINVQLPNLAGAATSVGILWKAHQDMHPSPA